MDLFDKVIVPICRYNSEAWGSAFFTKQSSRHSFLSENQPSREATNITFETSSWC